MAAITIELMKKKYGDEEGVVRYNKWRENKKGQSTLTWFINRYGEDEGTKKFNERKANDLIKGTLEGYKKRYGEIEGPIKYLEKNSRLSVSEKSLRLNGFTDEQILETRKKHAEKSAINLKNLISKYGEEEGTARFKKWKESSKDRTTLNISFWTTKGYSEEEAKKIISERQSTTSLEKFIKKYGIEEGTKKYIELNKKRIKYLLGGCVSKLESSFFDELSKNTYIDSKGRNCKLYIDEKIIICDYLDASNNKIIEINGDFWHMNPKKYKPTDVNVVTKSSAKEIWENEEKRNNILKNNGYNILIIWEYDLNSNYNKFLELAKNFLEN